MQRTHHLRTLSRLMVLTLIVALVAACAKPLANHYLKTAKNRLQEASEHNAEKYAPDVLQQVTEQVSQAQQAFDGQNYEAAQDLAKAAAEQAEELLDTTKARRAQDLKEQAANHVRVATQNQGDTINSQLFNQIIETDRQAQEALADSKFEKTIELCLQVARDTDTLLQNLKTELEAKHREAQTLLEELVNREYGRTEAPQYVSDTESKIDEMAELISYEQRQYLQAKQVFAEIEALVKNGIHEARRSRSKKQIATLEEKLLRARFEEAEKYHADFLASCESEFAAINKNFFSENFQHVLNAADLLEPRIDRLILETRILAAEDKIRQVVNAIASLEADKVRDYLPGRLEKIDAMLADARAAFEKDLFDEVKKTCAAALEEKELILQDFDTLAASEIRAASGSLAAAQALLDKMGTIFSKQPPPSPDPQRMAFEDAKQGLRTELEEIAKDSELLLGIADVQRQSEQYSTAIESARQVARNANYLTYEVYHVVAHNNVLEIADAITQSAQDGGARYASDQVSKAQATLEEARAMIARVEADGPSLPEGNFDPAAFKPAIAKTSEAYAENESVLQTVSFTASQKIEAAEEARQQAEANKADVYALGDYTAILQLIGEARNHLATKQLLKATEKADDARTLAQQASRKSSQAWSNETLDKARVEIELAREAGALQYALERFQDARQRYETARTIYQDAEASGSAIEATRAFVESKNLAAEAERSAREARLQPLTEARQAIVSAKSFQAWEYDYPTLLDAIINARNALEALENKEYDSFRALSSMAESKAESATRRSKNASFSNRVRKVSKDLEALKERKGGEQFAPKEVYSLARDLRSIRQDYSTNEYEAISLQLDEFEADLSNLMKEIPAVFEALLEEKREKLEDQKEQEAEQFALAETKEADKYLRFAEKDYRTEKYDSAYQNLRRAAAILQNIEVELQERIFVNEVQEVFAQLDQNREDVKPVLKIGANATRTALQHLRNANVSYPKNLKMAGADYLGFRRSMDNLYLQSQGITYPSTMQNEREQMLKSIRLAREASFDFEKFLILERYDKVTAQEITDRAFELIARSEDIQKDVLRRFETKGLQGSLAKYERIVGR